MKGIAAINKPAKQGFTCQIEKQITNGKNRLRFVIFDCAGKVQEIAELTSNNTYHVSRRWFKKWFKKSYNLDGFTFKSLAEQNSKGYKS